MRFACGRGCVCAPVGAGLRVCVYKGLAHPTIHGFATTHTDRCEDWSEREPRLRSTASLSKHCSLSLSLSQSPSASLSLCLSVSPSVSLHPLSPTVPNTEGLFVIQSRKCNRSQICPAFCLISSLLCSNGLPSPGVWPQAASA